MNKKCDGEGRYIRIPIQIDAEPVIIKIYSAQGIVKSICAALAENRIDFWSSLDMGSGCEDGKYNVEAEAEGRLFFHAIEAMAEDEDYDVKRPVLHYTLPCGSLGRILFIHRGSTCGIGYQWNPYGLTDNFVQVQAATGSDFYSLRRGQGHEKRGQNNYLAKIYSGRLVQGDVETIYVFEAGDKQIILTKSKKSREEGAIYNHIVGIPLELVGGESNKKVFPLPGYEKLRIWTRQWQAAKGSTYFQQSLAFRTAPGRWPNIRILEAEGKADDITAEAFEICLTISSDSVSVVHIEAAGILFDWDNVSGILSAGNYVIEVSDRKELSVRIFSDFGCGEIICNNQVIFLLKNHLSPENRMQNVDNRVSGNLEKCRIEEKKFPELMIASEQGVFSADIEVFGLRNGEFSERIRKQIRSCGPDEALFYKDENYTVYHHHVTDQNYGAPDAWAIHSELVFSPVRVMEEFAWRETPWGDMVRTARRSDVWYPDSRLRNYPLLHTGIATLDAACNIALDTFIQCSDDKYALEGQRNMWTAGLFQGEGEGFGVWMRDSAHIALRGGNLIDRQTAGKTLLYTTKQGFDNGSDGHAMPACGIWDYYLVTGDKTIIFEAWESMCSHMEEADKLFIEERGLIQAEQSVSNDAFLEPENGGCCLSTECYYMMAYEAMYKMGEIICENEERQQHWRNRAQVMRQAIRQEYFNPEYGYFTSGPKGSEAYEKGMWESSGEECAIWSRFAIASKGQKESVLKKLNETAMCEYGIRLFPHRAETNHFCGSVWVVWEAGFAAAASECGNQDMILRLIAQQIRNCIMNKTFYEVIDADSGLAWRWPGQLWHAAGFLSLILYGVFGMEYNEQGLLFHPCIPEQLKDISLCGVHYRGAVLNIKTEGSGSSFVMYLDNNECEYIEPDIQGTHSIILRSYQ